MKFKNLGLLLLILMTGVFSRVYQAGEYPFGFDQVQILENGQRIKAGDFTLIGPRTGPANMFTGPLIYYLTTISLLLVNSPYALVLTSVTIALATGIALILLARKYVDAEFSPTIIALWAASPFLILLDRVTWNPNLSLLSASLVFFPLYKATTAKLSVTDTLFLSFGIFLGYQAHFSGIVLYPLTLLFLVSYRQTKTIVLPTVSFLLSILPTIVFDARNSWLNWNGFYNLILDKEKISRLDSVNRILNNSHITLETTGRLLFQHTNPTLILITGLVCVSFYLYALFKQPKRKKGSFPIIWLAAIVLVYSYYRRQTPEYYYLIQVPALFVIISEALHQGLSSLRMRTICIAIFVVYGMMVSKNYHDTPAKLSLHQQLAAASFTQSLLEKTGGGELVFDSKPEDSVGMRHLLSEIPTARSDARIHVIFPYQDGDLATEVFKPNLAIWLDPRRDQKRVYVTKPQYIVSLPETLRAYQVYDREIEISQATEAFFIFTKTQAINPLATLLIFNQRKNPDTYGRFEATLFKRNTSPWVDCLIQWCPFHENDKDYFIQYHRSLIFTMESKSEASRENFSELLREISIVSNETEQK